MIPSASTMRMATDKPPALWALLLVFRGPITGFSKSRYSRDPGEDPSKNEAGKVLWSFAW